MHNFSFNFNDYFFNISEYKIAFRVFTMINTYTIDPSKAKVLAEDSKQVIEAGGFMWAGGQKKKKGLFKAVSTIEEKCVKISVEAEIDEPVKSIGLLLKDIDYGKVLDSNWDFIDIEVGEKRIYSCPLGWMDFTRRLPTPLYLIKHGENNYTFAVSTDTQVRPKRFYVDRVSEDKLHLELVFEEDARRFGKRITVPEWVIGRCSDPRKVVEFRMKLMEEAWGLKSWEERPDVPEWAKKIALVVNMHGKHWTGYVFNTYKRQLEILEWIADRIDGSLVLVFLPGWDGRYYYDYPRYEPDPDLGGPEGFRELIEGAHELGMHVLPMYSAVAVSVQFIDKLGLREALIRDKYGNTLMSNWVDWDNDRNRDNIWYPVNLGHPKWREYLFNRVCYITDTYGVDGAFFDIAHFYENDPNYSFYEGLRELVTRLQKKYRDFLVMGEAWYDALLAFIPLYHVHMWIPKNWPEFFLKYARTAYHLSWPAPGKGSSGVHEIGFSKFRVPDPKYEAIPTLSVVDDTIPDHAEEAEKVIEAALKYAKRKNII